MKRLAAFAVLAVVTVGACGTRVRETPMASAPTTLDPRQPASPQESDVALPTGDASGSQPLTATSAPVIANGRSESPSSEAVAAPTKGAAPGAAAPTPGSGRVQNPQPGGTAATGTRPAPTKPAPAAGGPSPQQAGSPIKLGHVNTLSGPTGAVFGSILEGVQLWAKAVNARGGVNGHPVQILAADNGGDPARHKSAIQALVERHGVVAFLGNVETLSGPTGREYLEAKQIPVIGMSGGEPWAYQSPMYFPQMSVGPLLTATAYASAGTQAVPMGKEKLGIAACTEVQLCRDFAAAASRIAPRWGFKPVYDATISLAQPDFTAECIAARNAEVETFIVAADNNTIRRVAASCARQAFTPLFSAPAVAVLDDMKNDPNLKDNFVSATSTFPYFQNNTPATAEFADAKKKFGSQLKYSDGLSSAWAAGKIFEKAAVRIPEPPTSAAILQGLWAIKNDTFGGITAPITYNQGRPATPAFCWFNLALQKGAWTSEGGFVQRCETTDGLM